MTRVRSHGGIAWRFGYPFSFSGPFLSQFSIGSSARSLLPFVHDFPYLDDASEIARRRHTDFFSSVCLSPSVWSSGFYPPRCYQRFIGPESSVLPVNLPPSAPTRFGVSSSIRFSVVSGNLRRQDRRASLGKTPHLPVSRPASCRVSSPDIRPRLITSARPPHQHHIAGSLFATYTGSASCFLQTHHF